MTEKSPAHIALDLDGTLIDCRERQVALMRHALATVAHDGALSLDDNAFWALKREGANNVAALAHLGYREKTITAANKLWGDLIETPAWLERDFVLPTVLESLGALLSNGYRCTLLSARKDSFAAQNQINRLGLNSWLSHAIFVSPLSQSTEKAEQLTRIGASVLVGDSESDGSAARTANVRFIGVSTGQRSSLYLKRNCKNALICEDLAGVVLALCGAREFMSR